MNKIKAEEFISGIIKCTNCGAKIKWRYRIPPKEYGMYISSYPTDTIFASKVNKNDAKDNTYCVRCKKCDELIYFNHDPNN